MNEANFQNFAPPEQNEAEFQDFVPPEQNEPEFRDVTPPEANNAPYTDLRDYSSFECIFAWLCILIGYLFCCAFPPNEFPLGTFFVMVFCVAATFICLVRKKARIGATAIASAVLSLIFSFAFLLNTSNFPTFVSFICALVSYAFFVYRATGNTAGRGNADFLPLELLRALKGFSIYAIADMFRLMFTRKKRGFKAILKILVGLIVKVVPNR